MPSRKSYPNIVGMRFGKLTVTRYSHSVGYEHFFACLCDCGKDATVKKRFLINGDTKSCGCLKSEVLIKCKTKHGGAKHPLYAIWIGMIERCGDPANKAYRHYGGRGIAVCDRWKNFWNFVADIGDRPPRKSIDRQNNNGNYEPGNCKWATQAEQIANRRPLPRAKATGYSKERDKWRAHGVVAGHRFRRSFGTEEEARRFRQYLVTLQSDFCQMLETQSAPDPASFIAKVASWRSEDHRG